MTTTERYAELRKQGMSQVDACHAMLREGYAADDVTSAAWAYVGKAEPASSINHFGYREYRPRDIYPRRYGMED